jgi:replicative DNA helicase
MATGGVEFTSTSEQLSQGVADLTRSLGGIARQQKSRITQYTYNGEKRNGRRSWRVQVKLPVGVCPFLLPRKVERFVPPTKYPPARIIRSVVPDGDPVEQVCIKVENDDGLYVTRDYIVTHNTIWLINTFQRLAMVNPDAKVLFVSLEQTADEWFERACRIYRFYFPEAGNEDAVDFWKSRIMIVDQNAVKEQELEQSIENFIANMGGKPDVVAVDYLGYWARGFRGESYERTSAAIMSLKRIAKDYRVRIIAPHQVGRSGKSGEELASDMARDSGVVEETADFVLGLWRPDNRAGNTNQPNDWLINIDLLKSRHGNGGLRLTYKLAPYSLALIPKDLHPPLGDMGKYVYTNQHVFQDRINAEIEWNAENKEDLTNSFETVIERHREKVVKQKVLMSKVGLHE